MLQSDNMKSKLFRWSILVIVLIIILLVVSLLSLCIGSTGISFDKIVPLVLGDKSSIEHSIVFDIRLPRIILGFAVGSALSVAGVILQGLFRNPLVEPYTLGISGGAALGICLNIVLGMYKIMGVLSLPFVGFAGALIVILFVYFLSIKKGVMKIQELLLTGVMISFITSSLIMLIMAVSRVENLQEIIFWIMGSLEEPNWILIKSVLLISVMGIVIASFFAIDLNALALGEESAVHLGVNVEKTKKILFVLASLLTGFSVSVTGIIGFVGLVIPHFVRMFVGGDHRILIIASAVVGGTFLILCDALARTIISPLELPVGVITGIIGGIIFIYFLSKKRISLGGK
ncbi:MAG: iron ABC transporter permease [bacterium]